MVALYLNSPAPASDWIGLVLVIAAIAILGAFSSDRGRKTLLVVLVLVGLGMARAAFAQPYPIPCDPLWRWLGWC